jgi:dephospho-CoA kinase
VQRPGRLLRVGLTGGIAAGKTTVASILSELGACVVDADVLAREALEPDGSAYAGVVARFGRGILDDGRRIRREALARLVFSDPGARRALNDLVHPEVRAEIERRIEACTAAGRAIAVVDAALLVETGSHRRYDRLVVVRCSAETQIERLRQRDGMAPDDARARVAAQAPTEEKVAVADYVIDTDGTQADTRRQTENVWAELLEDHRKRFAAP